MARRRTSPAEDLATALALLPWWACLAIGLIAYALLHAHAVSPTPPITPGANGIHDAVTSSMSHGLAAVGQYAIPIICLAAAAMSFIGRRKRRELLLHATEGGSSAAAIDAMSWRDFELLIGEAFRLQGFAVVEKGGAGPDDGVDLELTKESERWLVQAKHWRAKQVPVEVVRELAGVMPFRRAVGGYVITSGTFTQPAEEFARGRGIKLINGKWLESMLTQARASLGAKRHGRPGVTPIPPLAVPKLAPLCPSCSRGMVLRTAKKGPNAGSDFWGCSAYPKCRGTRDV
jgi:restriction system protein